jgi:ATP-binding cassette subfamily B protein
MSPASRLAALRARHGRLPELAAWSYLMRYFRPETPRIAIYTVIAAAQSFLVLPTLMLVRLAFDQAIPQHQTGRLIAIGAGLVGIRAFAGLVNGIMRMQIVVVIRGATMRLRRDLLTDLYERAHLWHVRADNVRLHAQIVTDTERVDNMADALLSGALPGVVTCGVLAATLVYLNAGLAAFGAILLPVIWLAGRLTARRLRPDVRAFQTAFEEFSHGVRFVLDHLPLTRARAAEAHELARQNRRLETLRAAAVRMANRYLWYGLLQTNLIGLAGVAILIAGGIAVGRGSISLGGFLAFYVAAGLANGQLDRVLGTVPALVGGNEALQTLYRFRRDQPPQPYAGQRAVDWQGTLAFERVRFAYDATPVLHDVSFQLGPRSRVAIVGPNGAGKTTILNLILGFYRPQGGRVTADGIAYDEIELRGLRRAIGLVPQHPSFFAGSLLENVAYGLPGVSRADAERLAAAVGALALLERLPQGLDTQIGEAATLLSGGERQLVAVMRALAGRPRLLILDEPTNHLDEDAVADLMAALTRAGERPSVLLISHDPAVVAHAEAIYRLDGGRLVNLRTSPIADAMSPA